jgi:hypothetical protein
MRGYRRRGWKLHVLFIGRSPTSTEVHQLMITSGVYVLESVGQSSAPGLRELLGRVTYVEGCGLSSVEMVMAKINEAEQASVGDVPHGSTRGSAP